MKAMKVATEEDKQDPLLHYGGNDIRKLMKKLPVHAPAEGVYKGLVKTLNGYFAPKLNRVYLMSTLHQLRPGENIDSEVFS